MAAPPSASRSGRAKVFVLLEGGAITLEFGLGAGVPTVAGRSLIGPFLKITD
jgi:hypothetical protein